MKVFSNIMQPIIQHTSVQHPPTSSSLRTGADYSNQERQRIYKKMLKLEAKWMGAKIKETTDYQEKIVLHIEHSKHRKVILQRKSNVPRPKFTYTPLRLIQDITCQTLQTIIALLEAIIK